MKNIAIAATIFLICACFSGSAFALAYQEVYNDVDIVIAGAHRTANSGTDEQPRWFTGGEDSVLTYWGNQWIEYTAELDVGNWNIGLNAINTGRRGIGTNNYYFFELSSPLSSEIISIPASDTEVNYGFFNIDIFHATDYTIRYTWLNDFTDAELGLDANIRITDAFFDRVGDVAPVPEPATMVLFGTALIGLAGVCRKSDKFKR